VALTGEGVRELIEKLEEHRRFLEGDTANKKTILKTKAEAELIEAIKERASRTLIDKLKTGREFDTILNEILEKKTDPTSAAEKLVRKALIDAQT
jgi:putative protein kinase ArgK-like GTPase of G3E family